MLSNDSEQVIDQQDQHVAYRSGETGIHEGDRYLKRKRQRMSDLFLGAVGRTGEPVDCDDEGDVLRGETRGSGVILFDPAPLGFAVGTERRFPEPQHGRGVHSRPPARSR